MSGSPRIGAMKLRAQIICAEETAMGPGKAALLEAIRREGSISAAGRALGMSYRRAWLLVDTMNRCWTEPLVEATSGGGAAAGARITPFGDRVLAAYHELEASLVDAAGAPLDALTAMLLPAPRPSQKDG